MQRSLDAADGIHRVHDARPPGDIPGESRVISRRAFRASGMITAVSGWPASASAVGAGEALAWRNEMVYRTGRISLAVFCAGVLAMSGDHDAMPGDQDAMAGESSYAAYNLFTGAPRFAIFKADPARELCVRVVILWAGPEGTVDLQEALPAENVSVSHRAADCAPGDGGTPPSLEAQGVSAQSVTGTATVRRYPEATGDRWTVSIDGVITFPPDEAWVPPTESLEADELEIVGGCC
jgi:hypothetical protein